MANFQSQSVKSLNKSAGRKRFVFKNFSQRVEEIEIDVYRSLDALKSEPAEGSSFFRESLLSWRELNTAEDFISFYEEMMPWVQTLPQILLHKEAIISKLLCRLRMQAKLSLEPILRLIAALSRDLLEEFLPFLQRITDSIVHLLKDGGERDPEILEQVFTAWSYMLMHLQKYLTQDIAHVLKITIGLRYYPKDYVQEFMAEAFSFLLRKAPVGQLIKGVRKVISEVVKKPLPARKSGASALLWHSMRGTSTRFHSRAIELLRLLMDKSIMHFGDKVCEGSATIIEVISGALKRICQELPAEELNLVLVNLYEQISGCIKTGDSMHLGCLLSLLIFTVGYNNASKISEYKPILELVEELIQNFIAVSTSKEEDYSGDVLDKTLQLMLCLLDIPKIFHDASLISSISDKWAPVFMLRNSCLLSFIKELILKDPSVLYSFRGLILRAMNNLVEESPEQVLYLMLKLFERLQGKLQYFNGVDPDGGYEEKVSGIYSFFQETISQWIRTINALAKDGTLSNLPVGWSNMAILWGVLTCYPQIVGPQADTELMVILVEAVNQLLLAFKSRCIDGLEETAWHGLVGAALVSYHKLLLHKKAGFSEISYFLNQARRYKSSQHVLFAVAEFLDSIFQSTGEVESLVHPELDIGKSADAIHIFAENLALPNKDIRVSTLRILCHYEHLDHELSSSDYHGQKRTKIDGCHSNLADSECSNVIQLLHLIEVTPLSIFTSRKVGILISRIERGLSATRISGAYIDALFYGVVGIFHNRFAHLWDPAVKCLTLLIEKHAGLVWDRYVQYLEKCQLEFFASRNQVGPSDPECQYVSSDLGECFKSFLTPEFDSTPCSTILTLLLRSLQYGKVPSVVESRSQQLIPLFFKFLGYSGDDILSVGTFNWHACKGKSWREVLKEWLNLLKLMRNPRSLFQTQALKEVLVKRLLDDSDLDVQLNVLDCLLTWKDDFLLPYEQNLKNLITSKNLREELTTWTLSREADHVHEEHRGYLIPIVIQILIPKVRKLKALASRKHAGVHHRRAVLSFLAQLDLNELPSFFSALLKPLEPIVYGSEGFHNPLWISSESSVDEFQASNFLRNFTVENINELSWKKRSGFLHVIQDILGIFDGFRIRPFLNLLMGFVVRILESCTVGVDSAKIDEPPLIKNHSAGEATAAETIGLADNQITKVNVLKQFKDLRSLCLKIISFVLSKHDCHELGTRFWDIFFMSVKPLIDSFKQEGSSSEKPSSLFSCFLAMSSSPTHVKLLDREENLVPIIFSILTVKTASDAIITSVLGFVENLLNLDNDSEYNEDCGIKRVLLPHIAALIQSVHGLFICRKGTHRKSVTWPGKTELRILKLLSKYIKESSAAQYFVDIMLPFLAKKGLTPDECIDGLHVMQGILPVLGPETTGKILTAVYPLLISAGLDTRLTICNILDALAVNETSMEYLAKLVRNLNAVSVEEMGEFDYDTRVNAYEEITPDLFSKLGEDRALVILSHCVYDMSSEELILRQSASKSLLSFVKFSGTILDCKVSNHPTMASHDDICDIVGPEADGIWTKTRVLHVLKKFYMRHVGEAMSKEITVQKEWITLLRDMVLSLPQVPALNAFRPLCGEDEEVDFFYNILHLQKYRRAKALLRFRNFISAGNLSGELTMKVFIPLFFNMLFEVKDGKGEHVRDACLECLASVSGVMQWSAYHSFLLRCFRELTLKPDKQKLLLRLICSIIDKFHFIDSEDHKDRSSSMALTSGMPTIVPLEIQAALQKSVFPEVHKLLTSDSERVNVHVSLAALKLLKLLPVDTMESQLPSIIHRISNFLKNRLESVRDEARSALAACFKELGSAYLHFIVNVLKSTLKRGYELHVLGYTLNFILSKTLTDCIPGKLDYCLEVLLSVAENDILGDVAEEKEVEKIASKMKETRKSKSFDTLKVIAQSITFKTHAFKLLSPIKSHLEKHLTQKVKTKLEAMLHHIALGIECNPSVDPADLFIFVYGLIEDGIGEAKSQNSHLVTVFGLRVLNNRLKNIKLDKRDEQLLSMLDPLVGHLGHCLKSKYEDIVSMALNCLALLVRLPLPSLKDKAKEIKDFLLDFAQRPGSASSPLMQSCLKLLTILLQSDKITLAHNQLRDLIQFLFSEMESNSSVALSLLKAIVGRRLVVNEIYDLVKHVAELMVTSQSEPTQKKCSQILLQFLLDYPLHEKRLQQHLDFLLENLSYVHPSGREAVLEMVHAVLKKFPKEVLNVHAENFFLKLVVCLANENNNKIQSMVGAAIKLLIENISQQAVHLTIDASFMWYTNEKQKSWSIGAQALGLLVEALKKGFQSHISEILPVAQRILTSAAHAVADKELKFSDEAKIPLWRESYYTLAMLEKIFIQFQDVYFQKDLEVIWELICKFLLHPHMWLRNISSRLVAMYFAETSKASRLDCENLNLEIFLLMEPSRLFSIAVSFCCQLKTQLTEEVTTKLITQNLVFAICGVHSFSKQRKEMTLREFWSTLCQSERNRFLEAFEALGSIRGKDMFLLSVTGDQCGQDKNESLPLLLVGPILKKMGKVALGMEDIQMKVVFSCFRTISSQIGYESCCDYAMHLLQPLYKVCEGFAGKVIFDEVKQLAAAVRDSIQRVLGTETFIQIYNLIRRNLKDKRDRRRLELKRMPVINPMRHAKRKLRVAEKHKAHKRRKIMKMKERK